MRNSFYVYLEICDFDKHALCRPGRVGDIDVAALGIDAVVDVLADRSPETSQVNLG